MVAAGPGRLHTWQEQYSDRLLTITTVLLALLLFVVAPLQAAGLVAFQAFGIVVAFFMIGCVLVMSASYAATIAMLVGFSLNVFVIIVRLYSPQPFDLHLAATAWLVMALTLAWVVGRRVFAKGRVNVHRVIGAVLIYLLIALAFVASFTFVALVVPNAFNGLALADTPSIASTLIYFSFVTLTSTGYGDIVPVHPVARSLCNLESIVGQLYPATLLARLVTLELESRR
jgi:hypothetical protein